MPPAAAAEAKPLAPAQRLERRFLQLAAANLRFQAEASRLAQARSNNPAVKDLANTLLARQQTAQPELLRLLHARGMAHADPDQRADQGAQAAGQAQWREVRPAVRRGGGAALATSADIANYEKLATQARTRCSRRWVERQLPTLRFQQAKAGKALPSASLRGQRAV